MAAELDMRPTKRLGQNFVHDPNTVRRIVQLAELAADDHVLEVGPGLGSLTLGLLEADVDVTAVEVDEMLANRLRRTVQERAPASSGKLTVRCADALRLSAGELTGTPAVLVANLPYNVAVPVVLHLLAELPALRRALVMVQTEVADRMAAAAGSRVYGVPSVKLAWYGSARKLGSVPRSVFWPEPNVDSALVSFRRHDTALEPGAAPASEADREVDRVAFFAVVDAAFAQRRKTLRAALAAWAGSADRAEAVLRAAGIDPRSRGEQLSPEEFIRLARARSV